jgi:enediyne biosynthesis protein E4
MSRSSGALSANDAGVKPADVTTVSRWLRASRLSVPLAVAGLLFTLQLTARAADGVTSTPFAPRSQGAGKTLFTTLPPSETGISAPNRYDDPEMWGKHYREFSLGAIGTGVAIADYDQDGKPDVYVVCKTGENHLFRNLGNFKFEDVTARAGVGGPAGAWKQGVAFVDVNNDGFPDLHVCRFAAANLLFINQRDGTFKEEAGQRGLAVVDSSGQAAFADYDRDGDLDVYLQTNVLEGEARPNGQRDYLFRNDGTGHFVNVTEAAKLFGETQGHSATWWDYNEDGWPDLYVANDFKDPDQLYRNNGDGTFTNVLSWIVPHTPHSSMGADLGDVNNDGHIDLLVADMAATSRAKDHRGMAKVRAGLPETDSRPGAAPQYMRNALFLNQGVGPVLEAAFMTGLQATDWTWSVRIEDLDNDGWADIFFSNGMVRELHGADLIARMMNIESLSERTRPMKDSPPLAETNLVFKNRGDLRFQSSGPEWGLDLRGVSFGAAFGDLDGDGDLDLVLANYDGEVTVCRNDSTTGHRIDFALRGSSSNRFGIGATIRIDTENGIQVRPLVLARGYLSTSEPIAHFGLGELTSVRRATILWPSGAQQVFENLAADRRYTVSEPTTAARLSAPAEHDPLPQGQFVDIAADRNLALTSKEPAVNELARQPLLAVRQNRFGPGAFAADLDGDGFDDLCVGGATGEVARFLFNREGNFLSLGSGVFSGTTQTADAALLLFDADADGDIDIFATKGGNARPPDTPAYQPRLFLNDGSGSFSAAAADALAASPVSAGTAIAGDFDRDGQLDVFVGGRLTPGAYPKAPKSLLLHNDHGKFADVTETVAPLLKNAGIITAAVWTDVDNDGWLDLLLAREWGTLLCLRNETGKSFTDVTEKLGFAAAGSGWWNSLAAADFNGDGRLDYVAGNAGLNTRYKASKEFPAVLYWGKFDGSEKVSLIEAEYENGKLYPVRGLPQLGLALPPIARKFSNFGDYATATLDKIFTPEQLAAAQKLEATELHSGVFLSQPDGTYRFEPLPRLAQTAPVFGTAAGDFDGDGAADIAVVQNSYAPIPEVSRFDGGFGWLLRGDGRGHFKPVPPQESAFIVQGDAKALAVLDFDNNGWADFFVTRNNGRTSALLNRGKPGGQSFGVALQGAAGNPTAIGARVTVTLADGRSQTSEVAAGSGYLSQSSATLFFGYATNNPPKVITVRWPDQRTTTHPWTPAVAKILLRPTNPAP